MKTIGLLGGMSWESSAIYYTVLNEGVRDRLGGLHSAALVLDSGDFAELAVVQREGRWDDAGALLAARAQRLAAAGAELVAICANTMHIVADVVAAAISVPLVHLVDVTAAECLRRGARTVGLLGTAYTMEAAFYRERLEAHGLTVLVPGPAERAEVHRIVYDELCVGEVLIPSRKRFLEVVDGLIDAGADAVILGCTEFGMLVRGDRDGVPLLDTTTLHCAALLDAALE